VTRKWFIVALGSAATLVGGAVLIDQLRSGQSAVDVDSIVLLGDSVTAQGDWAELLPDWPIVNRGFAGYTSAQLVSGAREIGQVRPRAVVVLVGTNDIRDDRSAVWTGANVGEIVAQIQNASPETVVVVQTVLPRSDRPDAVRRANDAISSVAAEHDVPVLDLYAPFDDGSGGLRAADTTDGIHLSDDGYTRWAALLDAALSELLGSPGDSS
jgi:lysophospholipase L1-like esterase